jgi:hypothetical protein
LGKAAREVADQLKTSLGKLGKADSDDEKADGIVSALDLTAFSGLSGSEWMLSDTATDRAEHELLSIGISKESDFFDHANDRAAAYAKDRAAELVTDIEDSTRDMLRRKIASGLEAGAMRENIIDDIMSSEIFSKARATLIADTEIAMANGQGALAGYKEAKAAGVDLRKIWVVAGGDCCDLCEDNADAGPIEIEDDFPSGDDAEPGHPNCRCHTESVVAEDDAHEDT